MTLEREGVPVEIERCESTGHRVNTDSNQTGTGHHMNVKHVCACYQV